MSQQQPNYKFYPTLLDAFVWYKQSESENSEKELIDKINRVPIADSKAIERMNMGSDLNDLVDMYVKGERFSDNSGVLIAPKHGNTFNYSLVKELGEILKDSVFQIYTNSIIEVGNSIVQLYGYIDYVDENKCIDLKTTSSYDLGKYKNNVQRFLYPVSLSIEGIEVDEFEFLVTDFNSVFKESYPVNIVESRMYLRGLCEEFILFIESKRHLITDKKVFALDEVEV